MVFSVTCECIGCLIVAEITCKLVTRRSPIHGITINAGLARSLLKLPDEAFEQKVTELVL